MKCVYLCYSPKNYVANYLHLRGELKAYILEVLLCQG